MLKYISSIVTTTAYILVFTGCHSYNSEPEKIDPIYSDLLNQSAIYDKLAKDTTKEYESNLKALENVVPQSGQLDDAQKKVFQSKHLIEKYEQLTKYYSMRAESRKEQDKITYSKAYEKGESWPPPNEWIRYKQFKALNQASRDWNARVPKPNFAKKVQIEKAPAGEGGEGEGSAEAASSAE